MMQADTVMVVTTTRDIFDAHFATALDEQPAPDPTRSVVNVARSRIKSRQRASKVAEQRTIADVGMTAWSAYQNERAVAEGWRDYGIRRARDRQVS